VARTPSAALEYRFRLLLAGAISILIALVVACGGGDGDDASDAGNGGADEGGGASTAGDDVQFGSLGVAREGGENETSADVELASSARTVSAAVVNEALRSAEDGVYRLDGDANLDGVEVGSVVLFEEHSLVRVLESREEGGEIVLVTEPAALNEYIEDGALGWDYAIDFGAASTRNWADTFGVFLGPVQLQPVDDAEVALKYSGEVGSLSIEVEIAPAGERLEIDLKGSKNVAGQGLLVEANGWIEGFRSSGNVEYAGGELQRFEYQNQELRGEMEIRFVGTRLGQQPEIFALPLRLDIPFVVYGIPMRLGLGANLSVTPELTGESSSEVAFKVSYSGSQGFSWSPTSARALGGLDNQALDLLTGDTAGFGPVGLGVTVAFPVMQLSVLHGLVVPSMVIDTHLAGFYSPDPACQSALVRLRGVVGVSLGVLGLELASAQETVFQEEHEVENGEGCAAFED
jgi:hypothetical protein